MLTECHDCDSTCIDFLDDLGVDHPAAIWSPSMHNQGCGWPRVFVLCTADNVNVLSRQTGKANGSWGGTSRVCGFYHRTDSYMYTQRAVAMCVCLSCVQLLLPDTISGKKRAVPYGNGRGSTMWSSTCRRDPLWAQSNKAPSWWACPGVICPAWTSKACLQTVALLTLKLRSTVQSAYEWHNHLFILRSRPPPRHSKLPPPAARGPQLQACSVLLKHIYAEVGNLKRPLVRT